MKIQRHLEDRELNQARLKTDTVDQLVGYGQNNLYQTNMKIIAGLSSQEFTKGTSNSYQNIYFLTHSPIFSQKLLHYVRLMTLAVRPSSVCNVVAP